MQGWCITAKLINPLPPFTLDVPAADRDSMVPHRSPQRWAGSGRSRLAASAAAGREATIDALAGRSDTKLLVVFASESHDLPAMLGAINEASGQVPLVGCSTAGEIATGGPSDASVVVFALGGPFAVATTAACDASYDLRAAGRQAASPVEAIEAHPHRVLLMLTDALSGDQQEILRGAYTVAGAAVPLVGGCAGDDLQMATTYQFHGGEVLTDAVVTAAIGSDGPFGIGVRHGWEPVGTPMMISRADGEVVHEIDGGPALDVYLERLNAPADAWTDEQAFTRFALVHPIGLARRSGESHARVVLSADFETRSLTCIAAAPEGSTAWFMKGDGVSVLQATHAACADALSPLDGHAPIGVLAFDCIARREVLGGSGIDREVREISALTAGAPVAGFYTYGEIARTRGMNGFHNETLVVLAVG